MNVLLIQPPNDEKYSPIHRTGIMFPLGLLSIATYLKENLPSANVEIIDGQITSQELILQKIVSGKPDVVGISPTICSYNHSTEEAIAAHDIGAKVVYGGIHATVLAEPILKNKTYVDAVVIGEGEIAFKEYVEGRPIGSINNFAYRDSEGDIRRNRVEILNLDSIPLQDFGLIDLSPYFGNFQRVYSDREFSNAVSIYTQKGCTWRQDTGGCEYCGRMDSTPRQFLPKKLWNHIEYLTHNLGIEFIMDVVDDFLQNQRWFQSFVLNKPNNTNPFFMVYSRVDEITIEAVKLLKQMNCYEVLIGLESGNQGILDRIPKGVKLEQNFQAPRILTEAGIRTYPQVVLGLRGETPDTLEDTVSMMEMICRSAIVEQMGPNVMTPLPGSRALIELNQRCDGKFLSNDQLDVEELQREWIRIFCDVNYDEIMDAHKRISLLCSRSSDLLQR